MIRRAALVLLAILAGCTPPSAVRHAPPLKTLAILAIENRSGVATLDVEEFANAVAAEFLKSGEYRILRPRDLEPGQTLESALRIRADAVVACAVTDYDPYDPPRIAVSVQVLRSSSRTMSSGDVDRLVASASWHSGPYALERKHAPNVVAAFEDVFDARDRRLRGELTTYAETRDSAFNTEREILAVQPRWLQFVANRLVHHVRMQANGP